MSQPKVLVLFGVLSVTKALSLVILELKKLVAGLTELDNGI